LRAPPVTGVGDFDLEGALADDFFEAVNGQRRGWVTQAERTILRSWPE